MRGAPAVAARKTWRFAESTGDAAGKLASALDIRAFIGQILVNRGVGSTADARAFLNPQLSHLADPRSIPGTDEAARRIREAVDRHEPIVIYGDYDVDGTTAIAILYRLLALAGANVSYYVPSRLDEGYGLNLDAMRSLADEGARLIVTVDCGITAVEEAAYLAGRGVDLVITDHHEGADERPKAAAIVNPKIDAPSGAFRQLAGVGVAFKLAWAAAQEMSRSERVRTEFREMLVDSLALVALGTIADVVPLVGENRVLVSHGLKALSQSRIVGVRALMQACGLQEKRITSGRVAFVLAPRLNAAGRMGDARDSVRLFVTDDEDEARRIAAGLERQNSARQKEQRLIFEQALELIEREIDVERESAIVLAEERWHSGVIGIVASRIVDTFNRPTVVITLEGAEGQGSARSIPALNLFETLRDVQHTLLSFGGHAQAAGLRLRRDMVDAFREAFGREVGRKVTAEQLRPSLDIDARVELRELDLDALEAIERMEPFGRGNRAPTLATEGVKVAGAPARIGAGGKHLAMTLRQGRSAMRAIAFGRGDLLDAVERSRLVDIAFVPFVSTFTGERSVELRIEDMVVY